MAKVAKALLIDKDNNYLLLTRSGHPAFGGDPDLAGGTLERGEEPLDTMLREVYEEIGVQLPSDSAELVYSGSEYSAHQTIYYLYIVHVTERPEVTLSWEHSSYIWLNKNDFIHMAQGAVDTYMHMVAHVLQTETDVTETV